MGERKYGFVVGTDSRAGLLSSQLMVDSGT